MKKYKEISEYILTNIGGLENISFISICATRLRISYKDKDLLQEENLKQTPDVPGVVLKEGQIQVVIGPDVNEAYNSFLEVSKWKPDDEKKEGTSSKKEESQKKGILYWLNKFGEVAAPVFMPVIPALITGGLILAIKNLMVNYFGFSADSGTAQVMLAIFDAGFTFLPVYIGYSLSSQLKMQPIMGAFLGALLISDGINGVKGLDFLGISIPQASYGSTIIPVILGVIFMYWIDKGLKKILPDAVILFLKPLLTMIIVAPVTLIVLGPLGTELSGGVGNFAIWLTEHLGFISQPILAMIYPYLVMLGIDKALPAIEIELLANLGYNSITGSMGFVSNLCIGGTALAVATSLKGEKKKGMMGSFGITALCGVTEPAFYGGLITRPKVLIGTAIGAFFGGLVAGLFKLKVFVEVVCPGLFTFLFFVDQNGDLYYMWVAVLVAVVSVTVSFIATKIILRRDKSVDEVDETDEMSNNVIAE